MNKTKNILLVEDSSGEAKGIISRLEEITEFNAIIVWAKTCDEALSKCETTVAVDAIIVDLQYTQEEGFESEIEYGEDLIIQIRKCFKSPPPIIVYTMTNKSVIIDLLVNSVGVDGYIIKGRNSLDELAYALTLIFIGGQYISKKARQIMIKDKNALEITRMDRAILRKLFKGAKINQLPDLLKKDGFSACGQATIENRIRDLKDYFDAKTTLQLVAIAKEKQVFMV